MKALTERKVLHWIHLIATIPIIGYIYGGSSNTGSRFMVLSYLGPAEKYFKAWKMHFTIKYKSF